MSVICNFSLQNQNSDRNDFWNNVLNLTICELKNTSISQSPKSQENTLNYVRVIYTFGRDF